MTDIGAIIGDFNESIASMFEDQLDVLRDSNIVFTDNPPIQQTYLWFLGKGPIPFYRNFESITINGCKRKLIPVVYITGLPLENWKFDHKNLRMSHDSCIAQTKYDRQRK